MNKWMEILIGLIFVIVPVWAAITYSNWGAATIAFLQGGVICFVVLIGLLFLMLGISDLKE
tara:strand:- start:50 stop:232 length:183 start_codon:yes stop_codon:yes gene_type:complete